MPPCYNTNCLEENHDIGTVVSGSRPDKVLAPPSGNIVMPDGDAMASYQAYGLCKRKLTDLPIP
ncbi:conserved protein of unknown function [Citrobacter amalonaticus]|uniref:Uncharacterized protein n=1 Tax=Citrobacter amalonaticus TaxID=35703 RepID=A0AAX2BDH5_CITAM|nr:conserved protein of unknown function [Citrobacter amalonaticus]SAZ13440.1 conserved protein of unknown function [Citrobacter amalonaticus]